MRHPYRTIGLAIQDSSIENGLIQAATATLNFNDVFTDGGTVWRGSLLVDFVAQNEPYTPFDYVELSTTPLVVVVPEPSTLALVSSGVLMFGAAAWRRNRGRRATLK